LHNQGIFYTYDAFEDDRVTHMRYRLASTWEFLYPCIAAEIE